MKSLGAVKALLIDNGKGPRIKIGDQYIYHSGIETPPSSAILYVKKKVKK